MFRRTVLGLSVISGVIVLFMEALSCLFWLGRGILFGFHFFYYFILLISVLFSLHSLFRIVSLSWWSLVEALNCFLHEKEKTGKRSKYYTFEDSLWFIFFKSPARSPWSSLLFGDCLTGNTTLQVLGQTDLKQWVYWSI